MLVCACALRIGSEINCLSFSAFYGLGPHSGMAANAKFDVFFLPNPQLARSCCSISVVEPEFLLRHG